MDAVAEFEKIRSVLSKIANAVSFSATHEGEVKELAEEIDSIGATVEGTQAHEAATAPASENAPENEAADPLAGIDTAALEAEIAKRQQGAS